MENDFITLGTATNHYAEWPVLLSHEARLRQMFVVGQTGTGKSTLLLRMAVEDLHAGNGFAFFDPHGDAAQELIDYIPKHRMDDVIYLRPGDLHRSFGFNILDNPREHEKDRVTQEVVSTFRYRWAESWGARMENIFKHTVRALLDIPGKKGGATLSAVPMMLNRPDYRKWVLDQCQSRAVQDFFRYEFDKWNPRQVSEFVQPILNKVDQFLLSDVLRNVIGQTKSTIDLGRIMDDKKILILDLDKGAIGQDDANTIGSILVTGLQLAAMRRSSRPAHERTPFYAYLDEFHSFTTGSFASIMSESRKYGFGLVVAGQYLDQIEIDQVRSAIFGNCANICCFRVASADAQALAATLGQPVHILENLPTGQAAIKYLKEGHPNTTKIVTDQLHRNDFVGRSKRVKRASERFTTPVDMIQERHYRWLQRIEGLHP